MMTHNHATPHASDDMPKESLSEIAQLDQFYHSDRGRMVAHFLRKAIQPQLQLESQIDRLGFGYPFICLPSVNLPVFIPSEMGALAYGHGGEVMTASIESRAWPIAGDSMNQIFMCHGLEYCHDVAACLSEANRVLASAGELILMVPNRASLWVRDDASPLGHGRPFSKGQITRALTKAGFDITKITRALFLPPIGTRAPLRIAQTMDHLGHYGWGVFGGVMVVRATKLRYATKPKGGLVRKVSTSGALRPARGTAASLPLRDEGKLVTNCTQS